MPRGSIVAYGSGEAEIETFVRLQQIQSGANNREEFTSPSEAGCARTSALQVNRQEHIKTAVIDNQDRFLSRSTTFDVPESTYFVAAEERIHNIETHLGILTAPCDKGLFERIKILEDKILKIEQQYPQIAAHCFNYGQVEREASRRPGGRVSNPDQKAKIKIRVPPSMDTTKVQEIQEKMLNLKKRLSKK